MLQQAKWIWEQENKIKNDWVMFYETVEVIEMNKSIFEISADTRYFLYINGEICVWDGGLFRDAYCEKSGFIDSIDITSYLHRGNNKIEILVWHYGNGGRNNNALESAGVLYSCEQLNLYSSAKTLCYRHGGFGETREPLPDYLYGGYNIGYNANWQIDTVQYHYATEYNAKNFGTLFPRPIPLFTLEEVADISYKKQGEIYRVELSEAHQVMPYFEVYAQGDEVIDIRSDRYETSGGPGCGGIGIYKGHRTEYICKPGKNIFLNFDYMACETLIFTIPNSVKVEKLSYRISEYDCEIMELFESEDEQANRLLAKCARTLKVCMRDNFMDCPDRERGQWIGDVSVQAPQVFYALNRKAIPLLKKAIDNFIFLRKGDRLVGNVPGMNDSELPSQSLNAISELGMIAKYYEFTGDKKVLSYCLEPMVHYLQLWTMGKDGMVERRQGDWCWFDHLNNQDTVILENTWYYSALQFAHRASNVIGKLEYIAFLEEHISSISNHFESLFWKDKYYASGEIVDDRANAMAVLTGLAKKEHYRWIRNVLMTTYNASTYMEGYVIEALYKMNYKNDGYQRMMSRYKGLIENNDSTLWEDFSILGTRNHAWSGAPLTIFYKYIAGISIDCEKKVITLKPNFSNLKYQKYSMEIADGVLSVELRQQDDKVFGKVRNSSSYRVEIINGLFIHNIDIENT